MAGGCSEPGGSVELQIISGIASQPASGWYVFIETPNGNAQGLLGTGDQTQHDNWALFDVELDEGDEVDIAVRTSAAGTVLASGTCIVTDARTLGYARITVYLHMQPTVVSCNAGFVHTF